MEWLVEPNRDTQFGSHLVEIAERDPPGPARFDGLGHRQVRHVRGRQNFFLTVLVDDLGERDLIVLNSQSERTLVALLSGRLCGHTILVGSSFGGLTELTQILVDQVVTGSLVGRIGLGRVPLDDTQLVFKRNTAGGSEQGIHGSLIGVRGDVPVPNRPVNGGLLDLTLDPLGIAVGLDVFAPHVFRIVLAVGDGVTEIVCPFPISVGEK